MAVSKLVGGGGSMNGKVRGSPTLMLFIWNDSQTPQERGTQEPLGNTGGPVTLQNAQREGTDTYLWLTHVGIRQKPTQHGEAIIPQLKIK